MNKIKEIRLSDYGFFILSPSMMKKYLTNKKIKGKKVLDKFDSDPNLYLDSISCGAWLPIPNVDAKKYFFSTEVNNTEWKINERFGDFNLSVGDDNCIWIGSLVSLNSWDYKIFNEAENDVISYKTLTGKIINKFIKFDIPKGRYSINLMGMSSENKRGYMLDCKSVRDFGCLADPRDDKYSFNL